MADSVPGPSLVSMAQQFSGLPMKSLIGGPLMAAADANQNMAISQVNFLMSSCFDPKTPASGDKPAEGPYTPIMVDMVMTRNVIVPPAKDGEKPTITPISSSIALPLMTLLPLNSLAVDNVTVNFVMEVKSSYSQEKSSEKSSSTSAQGSFSAKVNYLFYEVELKGSVSHNSSSKDTSSDHYQKSNSATYTVDVHAGQLPLPEGVTTILQAFTQNIGPIELPAPSGGK